MIVKHQKEMSDLQQIIVIIEVNIILHQLVITTGEELTDLFEIPNGQTEITIENQFIRGLRANMFLSQSNCQELRLVGNKINSVHKKCLQRSHQSAVSQFEGIMQLQILIMELLTMFLSWNI